MNSLLDIRIFLGLVPKESHCIFMTWRGANLPVRFIFNVLLHTVGVGIFHAAAELFCAVPP